MYPGSLCRCEGKVKVVGVAPQSRYTPQKGFAHYPLICDTGRISEMERVSHPAPKQIL